VKGFKKAEMLEFRSHVPFGNLTIKLPTTSLAGLNLQAEALSAGI
jgi:hypothetical protein